jgi:hypothetical protein
MDFFTAITGVVDFMLAKRAACAATLTSKTPYLK